MPGESKRTTNHDKIRKWVQDRGGFPATVGATSGNRGAGLLRIDFPGYSGEGRLKRISWEEFFDKFEEKNLVFLYQDKTRNGNTSRFSKFVAGKPGERRASARKEGGQESDAHAQAVRAAKRVMLRKEEINSAARQQPKARDQRDVAGGKRQTQRGRAEEAARAEHAEEEARARRERERESRPPSPRKRPPKELSVQDLKPGQVLVYEPGQPPRVENEAPDPAQGMRAERAQPAARARKQPAQKRRAQGGTRPERQESRAGGEEETEPQAIEVIEEDVIVEKEPRRAGDKRARRQGVADEQPLEGPVVEMEAEPDEETEEAIVIAEPVATAKTKESRTARKGPSGKGQGGSKSRKPAETEETAEDEGQPDDEVEEFIEKL